MPVTTPEMSPYGWVGAWNWQLTAMAAPDGVISGWDYSYDVGDAFDHLDYRYSYAHQLKGERALALRLSAERALTTSYATRWELSYGNQDASAYFRERWVPLTATASSSYGSTANSGGNSQTVALTWGHRVQSSGAWTPPGGWDGHWGPQGRAWWPNLDAKVTVATDFGATSDRDSYYYFYYPYYPRPGNDLRLSFSLRGLLPLCNWASLTGGYANAARTLVWGYAPMDPRLASRALVDPSTEAEDLFAGLSFTWPQYGQPDPLKNANPDGYLYHPRLDFETHIDGYYSFDFFTALSLPISPRSTWQLRYEYRAESAALCRVGLAYKLYGGQPMALTAKAP